MAASHSGRESSANGCREASTNGCRELSASGCRETSTSGCMLSAVIIAVAVSIEPGLGLAGDGEEHAIRATVLGLYSSARSSSSMLGLSSGG